MRVVSIVLTRSTRLRLVLTSGANRSQSTEAKKQFADQAVNPIIAAFSEAINSFVGGFFSDPTELLLWIEPYKPQDDQFRLDAARVARSNGDMSDDEFRTTILGLPPRAGEGSFQTTEEKRIGLEILKCFWRGESTDVQAEQALIDMLDVPEETARRMVLLAGERQEPVAATGTDDGAENGPSEDTVQPDIPRDGFDSELDDE